MNLLHIVHDYFPAIGGTQRKFRKLSEKLVEKYGDNVTVITSNALNSEAYMNSRIKLLPPGEEIIDGVRVKRLNIFRLPFLLQEMNNSITNFFYKRNLPFNDILRISCSGPIMFRLVGEIIKLKPDVVCAGSFPFLHIYLTYFARKIKFFPLAIIPCLHPQDRWVSDNKWVYHILRKVDMVLPNTEYEKDYLISLGIDKTKIKVIGLGIEVAEFEKYETIDIKEKYGIKKGDNVILFVGRKEKLKGIDFLIGAMKIIWEKMENVTLILAGGATAYSRSILAKKISMLKRVVSIDDFDEREKVSLYRSSDIVCVPSIVESFGIVYLEAWMCEKPVVACRIGAVCSLIKEGEDGLLVKYGNVEELANVLLELLKNRNLRIKLGRRGKEKVMKNYTWDIITEKIRNAYLGIKNGKSIS